MGQEFFELIGQGYVVLFAAVVGLALWLPKTRNAKLISAGLAAAVMAIPLAMGVRNTQQTQAAVTQEQLLVKQAAERFAELCKGAGAKVYRTVDDVEELLLLKVRPKLEWKDYFDPMLPGAAMAGEQSGEAYVESFLGVESHDRGYGRGGRGTIGGRAEEEAPRYLSVVAVEPDGQRYRYTEFREAIEDMNLASQRSRKYRSSLTKELTKGPWPRYAVDYQDIVNQNDRKLWIAGSKIHVLDQNTGDVLAEYITYVMDGGMGTSTGTRAPWAHAAQSSFRCPSVDGASSTHTRYFVDRVLKPKQGGK